MRNWQSEKLIRWSHFHFSFMENQISILNMLYPGHSLVVGKKWFNKCVDLGYLDDCHFHLRVVNTKFNPPYPVLL